MNFIIEILIKMFLFKEKNKHFLHWIARSHLCLFFQEFYIAFHSNCTMLYSCQQCTSVPICPHCCKACCLLFFDKNNSKRWEVILHCGFDLYFLDDWWYWTSFHILIGHLPSWVFCPFFCYWVIWVLYVFWILTSYQAYILKIFSPILLITLSFCWFLYHIEDF